MSRPVTIAVDAVGGDFAPKVVLEGVEMAIAADSDVQIILAGPDAVVTPFAAKYPDRVQACPTTEIIAMDEHPAAAVRSKKDSSIVVGCRLVKEGKADGFFSAGSTGACMAASTLTIGRIKGIARPAIATVLPGTGKPTILLDVGANADCKAENLVQFALMGQAYAQAILGVENPSVALLNIGEEETKGSQLAQDSYQAMKEHVKGFQGNVEGRDVISGVVDVIVTDGFTGNVVLKVLEGTSKSLMGEIKKAFTASVLTKISTIPLIGALRDLKRNLDPDQYGGAPLLGLKGISIIGHGSSSAQAVSNGILVGARAARNDLVERIESAVNQEA